MNTIVLNKVETKYIKSEVADFVVGDTVAVSQVIREGDKKRKQVFKGIVLAIKGSGLRKTFTVRKISYGVGVEKIFPLYSPNIEQIEILKHGKVRRSKIYYMRNRIGKSAMKIKGATDKELKKLGVIEGEAEETSNAKSEE